MTTVAAGAAGERSRPSAAAWTLDRWIVPILCLLQVWIATQVTIANLPGNKIFVGHDSGFYFLVPHEFLRLSTHAWQVKGDFGSPAFEGLVTQVLALVEMLAGALRLSQPVIGHAFFEFQLLLLQFGMFWSMWLTVGRAFPDASKTIRGLAAFFGSLVATFNIFTALLLMYPPSNFQLGIVIWPLVIAAEQYLLWVRPRVSTALLFGLLLAIATWGNPAHTILGLLLVAGFYLVNGIATKHWNRRLVLAAAAAFAGCTAFFWLPALSALVLYPGGGLSNVGGTDQRTLSFAAAINGQRQSIGALLRFDGLIWWPKTRNADLFGVWPLILTTVLPALVAAAAAFSRSAYGIAVWVLLLVGLELTKGLHSPLPLDMSWFAAHVPFVAAFRDTYSKFIVIILIALPTAYAIGSVYLWNRSSLARAAACLGFAAAAFNAWPFLAGRAAEPYFLTTLPPDYAAVDRLTATDPTNRILSFPGAPGGLHVTNWFKGGQFEDFLYRAKTVNAATFKERSISAATLFDDFSMRQARELPELMGLLGIYHINYVLLHKDYLTSYRMAFDYERYKVLGRLIARAAEPFLDGDPRLRKVFEGPNLVLYRVLPAATLPYVYGTYDAGLQTSYENALFGSEAAGVMDPSRHPDILFAGNQVGRTREQLYGTASALAPKAGFIVQAPLIAEDPTLYPNEIALPAKYVAGLTKRYSGLQKPTAYVFVQPHGDYISGSVEPFENIAGIFTAYSGSAFTPRVTIEARRVPREVFANFVGFEGRPAWPVSAFFYQPIPDVELLDPSATNAPSETPAQSVPIHLPDNTIARNVVWTVVAEPAAVTYQFRLASGPAYDEVIVASGPQQNVSLLDDPRVTFLYEMPAPNVEAAWLRFVLRGPSGYVHFDKQLDASGHLDDYSIRDSVQAALDGRFDELLKLHANDRTWITSQKFFNPEQADDYRLTGVNLIVGKQPGFDATKQSSVFSFKMRGITIRLAGVEPPAYPSRGYYAPFGSSRAKPEIANLQNVSTTRRNGALLVDASIQERGLLLNQSLSGRSASFKLKNGQTITANVLSELPDAYVISSLPGEQQQLYKSSIDFITAIKQGLGVYSVTMKLPPIDLMKYPELRVRYMQGSDDEDVRLHLGLETPLGLVEITPSYYINPRAVDQSVPANWIHPASPMGINTPLALDNNPIVDPNVDTRWREIVCDMRQIETLISTLKAKPRYLKLSFVLDANRRAVVDLSQPNAPVAAYSFGFGDVAFFGQEPVQSLQPPGAGAFTLDGHPLKVTSQSRVGGAPDLLNIAFATVRVAPGVHRLDTYFKQPWLLRTAALIPRQFRRSSAYPRVTVSRIDDLLYAVHVDAGRPAWLALTETYNTGWRLVRAAAPRGRLWWLLSLGWLHAPAGNHVVGNAYNNTWYVKAPSSGDYVIDFAPQDFAIVGRTVAICAVLATVALSILWWRRRW